MMNQVESRTKEIKIATKRAVKKTLKWYQSQVISYATKDLGIKRSSFKGRWFLDQSKGSLWIGLDAIGVHRFGKAKQNKRGVLVGGDQHDHAFIMNGSLVMERIGKGRLPIQVITKEVKDDIIFAFNRVRPLALARFKVILGQELNFVRNHK